MEPRLPDATFRQLRDHIHGLCGIYIPDTKKYLLETRLSRRIAGRGMETFDEYLALLRTDGLLELPHLFDAVTTNETYFFREPQQFDILFQRFLPRLLARKGSRDVAIWSAACSTGEEPYTLAILLRELLPDIRALIVGSDISESALESARRGIYSSYAVRLVPEGLQRKYFRRSEDVYELDEAVRRMVRFQNVNLIDEKKMRLMRNFDLVLCRNVLIYFDDRAKQKAVSHLYDSLASQGVLLVGGSESLHNVTRAFMPLIENKVILYQKG